MMNNKKKGQDEAAAPQAEQPQTVQPVQHLWQLRKRHGRGKIFSTPDALMAAAEQYFQWADENPLKEGKLFGTGLSGTVDKMRAYTLKGLCIHLGVGHSYLGQLKEGITTKPDEAKTDQDKEFLEVIEQIEMIIYTQKFEGAAAGLLNAVVISRELGLAEKTEIAAEINTERAIATLSDGTKIEI